MSIETALNAIVTPILATLSPVVPFYWGIVPAGKSEYVSLSGVTDSLNILDDFSSDTKQFNIVTKSGMVRAAEIRDKLRYELERYKGVSSSMNIKCISYQRSVELPDPATMESRIASEYRINYRGSI